MKPLAFMRHEARTEIKIPQIPHQLDERKVPKQIVADSTKYSPGIGIREDIKPILVANTGELKRKKMNNNCFGTITVIGFEGTSESFLKLLSQPISGTSLITTPGSPENPHFNLLRPAAPYQKFGMTAARLDIETEQVPFGLLEKMSSMFPTLSFHLDWYRAYGPIGQAVFCDGSCVEQVLRNARYNRYDEPDISPMTSLLAGHMTFSRSQQAALRVEAGVELISQFLCDEEFIASYDGLAEQSSIHKTLAKLLPVMERAAEQLIADGAVDPTGGSPSFA